MSLRLRLLLTIGLSLVLLWMGAAAWMLRDLDRELQHTLDERLAMSARMVAGLLEQSARQGDLSLSGDDRLSIPGHRSMACQVRSLRGEVLASSGNNAALPVGQLQPGHHTRLLDGQVWRTYTLRSDRFEITTSDRLAERDQLRQHIARVAGVPFLIAALGALLALWWGTARALAPLQDLRQALMTRSPDHPLPIDDSRLPGELRPAVAALNDLLARGCRALARERRFTDDAAHELRTPLTVIDTHLQLARLSAGADAAPALDDAASGVARLHATLEQLLLLARLDGGQGMDPQESVPLDQAIAQAIDGLNDHDLARLDIHLPEETCRLHAPPVLLGLALRNLIDNALRHAGPDATAVLHANTEAGHLKLQVCDNGPGLDPAACEQATQRFWRGTTSANGSGLGLPLVQAIAQRLGGQLRLTPRQPHGLCASLQLPLDGCRQEGRAG